MERKSIYENYTLDYKTEYDINEESYFLIFNKDNKLYLDPKTNKIPLIKNIEKTSLKIKNNVYIGNYNNKQCFTIDVEDNSEYEFIDLHSIYDINVESYLLGGRAKQVLYWYKTHQYCGACKTKTVLDEEELMLKCPKCGITNYTQIAPAIITAIKKDDKLLMARHTYFTKIRYALIAGFLEAGESVEEAVKREIKEEVGINVKNIKYFGSQSWPFPNSLMLGFTSEYDSGEISVDGKEIDDARWFSKSEIEKPKSDISISSELIKDFIENR
ncbi:MAG: NAD(+) diphosphatase [Methanobacteriaceae archaeon]|nr:NAD(+) diphosphatase [Methanobacteriaceae archaeon]